MIHSIAHAIGTWLAIYVSFFVSIANTPQFQTANDWIFWGSIPCGAFLYARELRRIGKSIKARDADERSMRSDLLLGRILLLLKYGKWCAYSWLLVGADSRFYMALTMAVVFSLGQSWMEEAVRSMGDPFGIAQDIYAGEHEEGATAA